VPGALPRSRLTCRAEDAHACGERTGGTRDHLRGGDPRPLCLRFAAMRVERNVERPACASCDRLEQGTDGARCVLRELPIAGPALSSCANPPEAGEADVPVPVGPLMQRDGATIVVATPSPDSRAIRAELWKLVDATDAVR